MKEIARNKVDVLISEAITIAQKTDGKRRHVALRRTNLLTLEAVLPTLNAESKRRALKTIENLREQMKRAASFAL